MAASWRQFADTTLVDAETYIMSVIADSMMFSITARTQ